MAKWWNTIRDDDPGLIRLKLAVRTTASALAATGVLLLLGKVYPALAGTGPVLMAAMSAALTVLRVSGETRREQEAATVVAGLLGMCMVAPAYLFHDDPLQAGLASSLLAFGVFYVRRFGALYVGLGMFSLFVYFFATIMAKSGVTWFPVVCAAAVSIPIAFLINFHFLPENGRTLFLDHVFLFLRQAGRVGVLMSGAFSGRTDSVEAESAMHEALHKLQALLAGSEESLARIATDDPTENDFLENIYLNEYRLYGAVSLAIDGILEAIRVEGPVKLSLQQEMENAVGLVVTLLNEAERSALHTEAWRQQLEKYRNRVETFYEDLLRAEDIKERRILFLMRVLLAMRRIGSALENLCGDLVRLESGPRR